MARGQIKVGLSGWSYDIWKEGFFRNVPKSRWLSEIGALFDAAEVNMTFYRTPAASTVEKWMDRTPDDFAFVVKGWRGVTHFRRLRDVGESIAHQRDALERLRDRTAMVLWQLPGRLKRDDALLADFAETLKIWPGVPHAIEFRHPSWFKPAVAEWLERYGLINVVSHAGDWPLWTAVTNRRVYVRLHGAPRTYRSPYRGKTMKEWIGRLVNWRAEGRDIYVFFDNDKNGHAPYDAARLKKTLGRG